MCIHTSSELTSGLSSSLSAASSASRPLCVSESVDSESPSMICRSEPDTGFTVAARRHRNSISSGNAAGEKIDLVFIFGVIWVACLKIVVEAKREKVDVLKHQNENAAGSSSGLVYAVVLTSLQKFNNTAMFIFVHASCAPDGDVNLLVQTQTSQRPVAMKRGGDIHAPLRMNGDVPSLFNDIPVSQWSHVRTSD